MFLLRIVLFASSEFSVPLLESLYRSDHQLLAVYTQPPTVSGRGMKIRNNAVSLKTKELKIELFYPLDINKNIEIKKLKSMKIDMAIVSAYGQILSSEILDIPTFGFINSHPSLLPRWRGAAPIERALMAGDKKTGVCTIRMVKELDAGPILAKEKFKIKSDETNSSLSKKLSKLAADQMLNVINNLKTSSETPQDNFNITYASKIKKSETRINWNLSGKSVDRFIRGLSEKPGAWTMMKGSRVKILNSRFVNEEGEAGYRIISSKKKFPLLIACGDGAVEVKILQKEGKKQISSSDFVRGNKEKSIFFE